MSNLVTDFAILIDTSNTITSLPTGTRRAVSNSEYEGYKIIIGKASDITQPFCNGISSLPFFALPASPNFSGRFVIIGRVVGEPTYWGCTDVAALVVQCTALNNGNVSTFDDAPDANRIANCKTYLDANGYALSNNSGDSFLASYFA